MPQVPALKSAGRVTPLVLALAASALLMRAATPSATGGVQGLQFYAGITCTGTVGVAYQLQYTTNLQDSASWVTLTNVVVDTNRLFFVDLDSPQSAGRFYRLTEIANNARAAGLETLASQPALQLPQKLSPIVGWNEVIDPDHDCRTQINGDTVHIEIPATAHDFAAELKLWNTPRLLTQVTGDFVLDVRVDGDFQPGGGSTIEGRKAYHGAGLLLVRDDQNHLSLQRGAVDLGDRIRHYANFELRRGSDGKVINREFELEPKETYLRLARRGNKVLAMASQDGSNWRAFNPLTISFPETLNVGVEAINSAQRPFACSFQQLSLYREVANPKVAGTWTWSVGGGKYRGKMELRQAADGKLSGRFYDTTGGSEGTLDGAVLGNVVQFTRKWDKFEQAYNLTLNTQGTALAGVLSGNRDHSTGDGFIANRE